MYLHSKLDDFDGKINIAFIGCGKFISMFLAQYNQLKKINIDTINLEGSINLIGEDGQNKGVNWGNNELEQRKLRSDLKPQDGLPEDTILWAHLQSLSGGAWNGCVYDFELISKNTL